jgi:hypothetical protein
MAAGQDYWWVTLGAILGHACCTGVAVIGGRAIAGKVSLKVGKSMSQPTPKHHTAVNMAQSLSAEPLPFSFLRLSTGSRRSTHRRTRNGCQGLAVPAAGPRLRHLYSSRHKL